MQESIEVYIRPSGDRVLLNIYVPKTMQAQFRKSIDRGSFEPDAPMNLEFSVLPQWLASAQDSQLNAIQGEPSHVRVALSAINIHYVD